MPNMINMNPLSRRAFVKTSSAAATGLLVPASVLRAVAETAREPHISFPTAPRDRISVTSYPFRAHIESPTNHDRDPKLPGMDLKAFAAELVKRFNVHHIEPHSRHFASLEPEHLRAFRGDLNKISVTVVDIAVAVDHSFYDADASARTQAIADAKKFIDVAVQIGSPSVRVHVIRAKNSQPDVSRAAESLREVAHYGADKNVVVSLENDDLVSEGAFFLVKIIEAVNHPFLRALPDFGNSMLTGDENFDLRALEAMFRHAYGICHVKGGVTDDKGKHFDVDLKKSFDILKKSGYRGYCSMEAEVKGDPFEATKDLIEQTIKYLS